MTIAIPLFMRRASPNFSTAPELLIVQVRDQQICVRAKLDLSFVSLLERRKKLLLLGVDILVCGGLDRGTLMWLEARGIRVMAV
ncbi:MAG TPA: hypothetical protein PLM79_00365 [Syntrophobacteraceae bacterium]|nr:hypothetical protein [Syntrophobacteraceae bacterium]